MGQILMAGGGAGGVGSEDVTAIAADVLIGKTALTSDSNDEATNGSMPNNGAITTTIGVDGAYVIPVGYHNGSGVVSGPTLSGNATAAMVRSGYTFYSNSGTKLTGTIANYTGTVS